jgi:hypothetical protein
MPRDERIPLDRQFAFDDVQIGPADSTCPDPEEHLPHAHLRLGTVLDPERLFRDRLRSVKNGGLHN